MIQILLALLITFGMQAGEGVPAWMGFMNAMLGGSFMSSMVSTDNQKKSRVPSADQKMLIEAVKKGDCDHIKNYLDEHENAIPKGLLNVALIEQQKEVVDLLLERGAHVNERCAGMYPLHVTTQKFPEMVDVLIAKGACVNSITKKEGATPLHIACIMGNEPACAALLAHGALLNARDHQHRTPLHKAAWQGDMAVATQLLQAGASLNVSDHERATPLMIAIAKEHKDIALEFIKQGAQLNRQTDSGDTELHYAVRNYDEDVFKALLAAGANPNVVNNEWQNALYVAAQNGCVDAVKALFSCGDINAMSKQGNTMLFAALWNKHEQVASLLLQAGANPNRGQGCHKPLHIAVHNNLIDSVRLLLQKGADVSVRDKKGKLPCDYAKTNDMIALLSNEVEL